jgi:phenylpropionate dioxygenase-like ring-hydroxylating dioxygenase large terminal subunit
MYQDVIAADSRPSPPVFREYSELNIDIPSVPRERYVSQDFFNLEIERLWPRVWQLACREEQIPEVGDCLTYDSPGASLFLVRCSAQEIKAYYNTCPHRGMRLCASDTSVSQIRCPYHGFTWHLDGSLAYSPARWDFPQLKTGEPHLEEVRVASWGGFVFINRDPQAPSLQSYLANLPEHFATWPREDVYLSVMLHKVMGANWKACIEGFVEAFHVAELHSQARPFGGDSSTQYDVWPGNENISRFLEPTGIPSEEHAAPMTEQKIYAAMHELMTGSKDAPDIGAGTRAREVMAQMSRTVMSQIDGRDYSELSVTEALDPAQYSIFPNIVIFRSLGYPYLYRFLPLRDDPHHTQFDFMIFRPKPRDGSPIPEVRHIHLGQTDTYQASGVFPPWLGQIYDQDTAGFGQLQEGLRSGASLNVMFSRYQEIRIRHMHQTLMRYLSEPAQRR